MIFSNLNSNYSNLLDLRSRNNLKKHSVTKMFYDLSLFEQIVLEISNFLQILGLQPRISKVFPRSPEQFFLTAGQNNFGNKIPFTFIPVLDLQGKIAASGERI